MQCIKDNPYSLNCSEETVITDYYMNWLLNIFCTTDLWQHREQAVI